MHSLEHLLVINVIYVAHIRLRQQCTISSTLQFVNIFSHSKVQKCDVQIQWHW